MRSADVNHMEYLYIKGKVQGYFLRFSFKSKTLWILFIANETIKNPVITERKENISMSIEITFGKFNTKYFLVICIT